MADKQITFRVNQDLPSEEEIKKAMADLGLSKNQLITEGIKMMCTWDKVFYSQMKDYAEGVGLTMAQVMQNFLIKRLADDAAEETIYGDAPRALVEFPMTTKGVVTGKELFEILYEDKIKEIIQERLNKIEIFKTKYGEVALPDDDKEFLKKYGA